MFFHFFDLAEVAIIRKKFSQNWLYSGYKSKNIKASFTFLAVNDSEGLLLYIVTKLHRKKKMNTIFGCLWDFNLTIVTSLIILNLVYTLCYV